MEQVKTSGTTRAGWAVDLAGWSRGGGGPFYEEMSHRRDFKFYVESDSGVLEQKCLRSAAAEDYEVEATALGMLRKFQRRGGAWEVDPGGVAWASLRPVDASGKVLWGREAGEGEVWKLLFDESGDGRTPPVLISWNSQDGGGNGRRVEVRPELARLDEYESLAETEEVIRRRMGAYDGYEMNIRVVPASYGHTGYTGEFAVHFVDKPHSHRLERDYAAGDLARITLTENMDYRQLAAAASDEEAVETAAGLMWEWLEDWAIMDQASDFEPVLVGRVRNGPSPWRVSDGNRREGECLWTPEWTSPVPPAAAGQDILVYPPQSGLPAMAAYTDGTPGWSRAGVVGNYHSTDAEAVRDALSERFGTIPVAPHSPFPYREYPARRSAAVGAGW